MKNAFIDLNPEAVAQKIRAHAMKKWWVAEVVGVHKTTLRRWLTGHIKKVKTHHVFNLAQVLQVDPSTLAKDFTGTPPSLNAGATPLSTLAQES